MVPPFTFLEIETVVLYAVMLSINNMVDFDMISLEGSNPETEVWPLTPIHLKYFNILLLDFLKLDLPIQFRMKKGVFEILEAVLERPQYNTNINKLKEEVSNFKAWLEDQIKLDDSFSGCYLPEINPEKDLLLKITRRQFVEICGNISKHNFMTLTQQAKILNEILKNSDVESNFFSSILSMDKFFEHFHTNVFRYHLSTISEFLNNIRWEIYEYLQPALRQYRKPKESGKHCLPGYDYPQEITDSYVRVSFSELMNLVSRPPCIKKFTVSKCDKMSH